MMTLQYNNYRLSITNYKKIKIVNYKFGGSIEMKANLPEKNFFDSFYIWFNKEKREEYYSTPLYLYSVNRKDDFENLDEEKITPELNAKFTKMYEECFFKTLFEKIPEDYKIMLVQVMPKTLALSNKSLVKDFLSSSRMSSLEMYFDIFSYSGIFS